MLDRDRIILDRSRPPIAPPATPARRIGVPEVYERAGPFEIRLSEGASDLKQAQRLRYNVFYEQGTALATVDVRAKRRDLCPFDAICDHLLVIDTEALSPIGKPKPKVVGTYRLLRRDQAELSNGFYSQGEFDLSPLLARHPQARFLELGRSCVHANYRSKRVIELLWRGLWLYSMHHRIDALIGCASFPGMDLDALRTPLSFLLQSASAEDAWQVAARPHCAADFTPLDPSAFDQRRALVELPPLIKAYLRTGARFGRDVVIDRQFRTIDVFAVMRMGDIEERYRAHFGAPSCVSGAPVA